MFYMPTIALSNSVAYNALDLAKLDAVKHFPPIRVWGTVGFIAAMWFVDLVQIGGVQIKLTYWQLYVSALLSLILAIYSFTLPGCPVSHARKSQSWIDTLGLRAFALFKEKRMAIFFIFSMLWAPLFRLPMPSATVISRTSARYPNTPTRPSCATR